MRIFQRDKDAGSSEAQKPVEQVTVKAEEKHELEQKPDTKSHKEETTQSAPAQKPEPEKAETQQTKPEETKPVSLVISSLVESFGPKAFGFPQFSSLLN